MTETRERGPVVRFGPFEVNLRTGELRKHERKVKLAGHAFEVLAILLDCPGELVSREEIRGKLWPADTFVDFEHGLNTAVRRLRAALGDSAQKPRFIETLARRGYRFVGSVEGQPAPRPAEARLAAAIGQIAALREKDGSAFLVLPVDEEAAREKEKLDAAHDDLGFSMLVASRKLLLVACGTKVRILEARGPRIGYQARVLEGECTGETVLVPHDCLQESELRSSKA